jgi:phosphatidylserine/phosphatidylglycerophosphate/cardiolipin synthase-like enzyme
MRRTAAADGFSVHAVAGNHAVFFGFDLSDTARPGCLGFALQRTDRTENQTYWLSAFKTFRSQVPHPVPTQTYTTNQHPIQGMWWGDYSAKPAHNYRYTIVPLYGTPGALTHLEQRSVQIELTTNDPDTGTHRVYFNRGVAASQAYTNKFGHSPNELTDPAQKAAALAWLSRGLHEALCAFITDDASPQLALRAAVYEFTEPTVLAAFAQAHAAGADVKIIYHAKNDDQGKANETAITAANLDRDILIKRTHTTIAHNKFIVRADRDPDATLQPQQAWTGSTNLSQGGIFGHANVGHAVREPETARAYLDYWTQLATDPLTAPLRHWVSTHSGFDPDQLAQPGIHTLFSPRDNFNPLDWYAHQFATAAGCTQLTLPFGMDDKHFETQLAATPDTDHTPRFVMLNRADNHQTSWGDKPNIEIAVGAEAGPDLLSRWASEHLTGFNPNVPYLHTKILLLSPLQTNPTVITGSANFSEPSTNKNDENMLIITANTDVTDIYFTEYMRIFQHFYARWWANHITAHTPSHEDSDTHSFLTEDDTWQKPYWNPHSPKNAERILFSS